MFSIPLGEYVPAWSHGHSWRPACAPSGRSWIGGQSSTAYLFLCMSICCEKNGIFQRSFPRQEARKTRNSPPPSEKSLLGTTQLGSRERDGDRFLFPEAAPPLPTFSLQVPRSSRRRQSDGLRQLRRDWHEHEDGEEHRHGRDELLTLPRERQLVLYVGLRRPLQHEND
jgi:hypothetical protein